MKNRIYNTHDDEVVIRNDVKLNPKFSYRVSVLDTSYNMGMTGFNERYNGRLHYNTGRRINNGFIRFFISKSFILFTLPQYQKECFCLHNDEFLNYTALHGLQIPLTYKVLIHILQF